MKPKTPEDLDATKISYMDGSLSPEERKAFEEHLAENPDLREEMNDLEHILKGLTTEKELVFCPPQWKLFDYAAEGRDPDGSLARHVGRCERCQEVIAAYRQDLKASRPLPSQIREAFEAHSSRSEATRKESRSLLDALRGSLSALFDMRGMALAAAAAAILVVVLLYPSGDTGTVLGLSSVTWPKPQGPMIFMRPGEKPVEKPERVAVLLFFKGFEKPLSQERIDALYGALTPPAEVWSQYEFTEPAKVQDVLKHTGKTVPNQREILEKLHRVAKASQVLTVTVIRQESGFTLEAARIDLSTGRIMTTREEKSVTEKDLPEQIRNLMSSVLQ